MSQSLPWYKRDVDAWRGGTRCMSLELRGFYSELLDAMWDQQGPITSNIEKLSRMICCNPRTVRKLLPQLIALGKIIETADGLTNNRMASEIATANSARPKPNSVISKSNSVSIRGEFDRNSTGIRDEFELKNPKSSMFSTRDLEVDEEEEIEEEKTSQHLSVARLPALPSALEEFFGSAGRPMVVDAMRWLGKRTTPERAGDWLTTLANAVGPKAVAEAYAQTVKGIEQGVKFEKPIAYWTAAARSIAHEIACRPPPVRKISAREAIAQLEEV